MVIYGVALLGGCLLAGVFLGDVLGRWIGVEANVGGVGIAMLLLIAISHWRPAGVRIGSATASGVSFWSALYIPIVVAMAARQNVVAAVEGGWLAILAGVGAVAAGFALVPALTRLAKGRPE